LVLVEDAGETVLHSGDSAGWPAGVSDGHHLQNRSQTDATFLVVGTRNDEDHGEYSDIDMAFGPGRYTRKKAGRYLHKDGTPY
ncbi:MAG: transcriptional regulator, partial [Myxococcales bacterium]|nr:transcriptional regulator [Myxococcales bacterium]